MQSNQLNIEALFLNIYNLFSGARSAADYAAFSAFLAKVWIWITVVGYLFSVVALIVIVYVLVRLFELRKREEIYYSTLLPTAETTGGMNPRWAHIQSLV